MKTGKKVLSSIVGWLVFLVLLAGAGAVIGWVEFAVPTDRYGVLATKTSGVLPKVYEAGGIDWAWQRLIPTNAELLTFPKVAVTAGHTVAGTLPSGEFYAKQADGTPDFTYAFIFDVTLRVKPAALLALVNDGVRSAADLDAHIADRGAEIAQSAAHYLVTGAGAATDDLAAAVAPNFDDVELVSIVATYTKMPDLALYNRLKAAYAAYQAAVDEAVKAAAREQAAVLVRSNAALDRLARIGELFEKYPALAEVFTKTGDLTTSLKAFNLSE